MAVKSYINLVPDQSSLISSSLGQGSMPCSRNPLGPEFIKFMSSSNDFYNHYGGHLAPSSYCTIHPHRDPLAGKGSWEMI